MHFTTTTALIILGSASTMASPYMVDSSSASSSSAAPTVPHEAPHPYGAEATASGSSVSVTAAPTAALTGGYGDVPPAPSSSSASKTMHRINPHECGFPKFPRSINFAHNATVPCAKEMEGHKTCSTDETMIAVCHDGKWCPKTCGKSSHGWELACRSHIRFPMFDMISMPETVVTECTGFEDWLVPEPNEPHRPLFGHGPVVHPLHESASSGSKSAASEPTMMPTPAGYGGVDTPLTASSAAASASASASSAKVY